MTARSFNQGIGDCKCGVQRGSIKIAKCHPLQTGAVNSKFTRLLACVASVSSRSSSRKLGQEQKKMNDGGGGGERRNRLPANPTILKNCVRPRTQLLIGAVRVVLIT